MSYQQPMTIKKALEKIHRNEFVLPSIQREFVWSETQICHLFDSLMQGYPVGSFLFWKVEKENSKEYVFYDFLKDYHQIKARHCKKRQLLDAEAITAILDGQQRLTSLNIGLRGTLATKVPRMRRDNPAAYPSKRLYLNIAAPADENDLKMVYDFRFFTEEQAAKTDETHVWFPVHRILDMDGGAPVLFTHIQSLGLAQNAFAFLYLERLFSLVHRDTVINYYEEESQDLDKVLNIFIRMNSGGKPLTYSDMLLSIATAQWKKIDAREEIHQFVDAINDIGDGFEFSKDVVLKAGLMLCDIPSITFKVTNFNMQNMTLLESNWTAIKHALRLATNLLADFGFSAWDLSADSVLVPIAYYVHRRGLDDTYRTSRGHEGDREQLRRWIIRSLVKPGIWGSSLDQLLTALRTALKEHGANGFPGEAVESAMAKRGKSLRFDDEEIEVLLDFTWGEKPTFALLALLYPGMDFRNDFHIDHIFPRSQFTAKKLASAGISPAKVDDHIAWVDTLGNLQLLEGIANKQKSATLPAEWLSKKFADAPTRAMYCERHDLGTVPKDLKGFETFLAHRREKLTLRLKALLGVEEAVLA